MVTKWLRVPSEPPWLSGADDQSVCAFRPAEGYLEYLKFYFWIGLFAVDIVLVFGWVAILIANPFLGTVIAPLAWAIIILPDIVVYIAIHLRYDTTWYILSDRTLRIRRGIWTIQETTITFDNIQNVSVRQGPIERMYGICDVVVETAGGGGSKSEAGPADVHTGLLEGVNNAEEIRQMIMKQWLATKTAGLGDEATEEGVEGISTNSNAWNPNHVAVLRQIRDLVSQLR